MKNIYNAQMFAVCFLVASCCFIACKKSSTHTPPDAKAEEILILKADADFNSKIYPGIGNIFYENKFIPSKASQLVSTIAVNGDTIGLFGKISSTGKVQYIHTAILSKTGSNEQIVTENFPESGKSRMYTISNNVKSRFVIEAESLSTTGVIISIVDYDWVKGTSEIISSSYHIDGQESSNYVRSSSVKADVNSTKSNYKNCFVPQESDDLMQSAQNLGEHYACGGLAFDTAPFINDAVEKGIDIASKLDKYKNDTEALNKLKQSRESISSKLKLTITSLSKFKAGTKSLLSSLLKKLEDLIDLIKTVKPDEQIRLVVIDNSSDLDYDEISHPKTVLTIQAKQATGNFAYTETPVYVGISLHTPGKDLPIYSASKPTSMKTGLVEFIVDPLKIPNIKDYKQLELRYFFVNNPNVYDKRATTMKFITPKVFLLSGDLPPAVVWIGNNDTKAFQVLNEDKRIIPVNYSDVTLANNTNDKVTMSIAPKSGYFDLKAIGSTGEVTSFDLKYKGIKMQSMSVSTNDSLKYYQDIVPGNWTMTWKDHKTGNDYGQIDKFTFDSDGTGKYYYMTSGGKGIDIPMGSRGYNVRWEVDKANGDFYLKITYLDRNWISSTILQTKPSLKTGKVNPTNLYFFGVKQ